MIVDYKFYCRLFALYNMLENPYSRFVVYIKALELAVAGKVTESIIPSFNKIDAFLSEWNIDKVDQRALFHSIANIVKDNKRFSLPLHVLIFCIFLMLSVIPL
jgi:translation initiation factor 3 subunit M